MNHQKGKKKKSKKYRKPKSKSKQPTGLQNPLLSEDGDPVEYPDSTENKSYFDMNDASIFVTATRRVSEFTYYFFNTHRSFVRKELASKQVSIVMEDYIGSSGHSLIKWSISSNVSFWSS